MLAKVARPLPAYYVITPLNPKYFKKREKIKKARRVVSVSLTAMKMF